MRRLTFPDKMPWDAIAWLEAGSLPETEIRQVTTMVNTNVELRTERSQGYFANNRSVYRRPMFQVMRTHTSEPSNLLEDAEGYLVHEAIWDAPMRAAGPSAGPCKACYDFQYTHDCPEHPEQPIGRTIYRLTPGVEEQDQGSCRGPIPTMVVGDQEGDGELTMEQVTVRDAWNRVLRASLQRHGRVI